MHETTLVGEAAEATHQNITRHRLPEHLDAQYVCYDLLCLTVDIRMDQGHVVIADNAIAKGRQPLVNSLGMRERVIFI